MRCGTLIRVKPKVLYFGNPVGIVTLWSSLNDNRVVGKVNHNETMIVVQEISLTINPHFLILTSSGQLGIIYMGVSTFDSRFETLSENW